MTAEAEMLLARTKELLDTPDRAAAGNSARLAAFLARQVVEDLIDARCASLCGVQKIAGTMKAKLSVLKSIDPTPTGATLIGAWHRLTSFCHQHAYQLSQTVAEVRAECAAIERDCLSENEDSPDLRNRGI